MFRLKIKTDNAAFEDEPGIEIARILREAAAKIEGGRYLVGGILRDINGNTVGDWTMTGKRAR